MLLTQEQQVKLFKRIILHNKLMPPDQLEALVQAHPEPKDAVGQMVADKTVSSAVAQKLLALYTQKLRQLREAAPAEPQSPGPAAASGAAPGRGAPATPGTSAAPALVDLNLDAPGPGLIRELFKAARAANASDLHVKSGETPLVRVGGQLRELTRASIPTDVCRQSLLSILSDSQKQRFEKTHDLDFCYDGGEDLGRFRSNYFLQLRGVDAVFRLIAGRIPAFDELGIPPQIRKFTEYRQGIVLVTGPKGSGKTTTLAALIDVINSARREHIITIEDPIEYVLPHKKGHVNQREVGTHTDSFSNALEAAMREAPDVIMVGEMRDLETTSLAITAAETGLLVFATLPTPDAARTIGRVLDVFPPKEQGHIRSMVAGSLRGIVSQLLVPNVDGTGMVPAVEIMVNTPAIGNLIRDSRTFQLRGVMQTGKRLGMILMEESLVQLVKSGKISRQTALEMAENESYVKQALDEGDAKN